MPRSMRADRYRAAATAARCSCAGSTARRLRSTRSSAATARSCARNLGIRYVDELTAAGVVGRDGHRRAAAARLRERRAAQAGRPHVSRHARVRAQGHVRVVRRRPASRPFAAGAAVRVRGSRCARRAARCRWPSCCRIRTSSASPARRRSWAWTRSPSCAPRAPTAIENDKLRDKFAMRLANSLSSHGPALLSTMLAPSYSLSKSLKNPALLDSAALGRRLHARAADSAERSRRVRVELDRVLRVRAADGARLSRLSAPDDDAVDRGGRRDAAELADPRCVRSGRADDAHASSTR